MKIPILQRPPRADAQARFDFWKRGCRAVDLSRFPLPINIEPAWDAEGEVELEALAYVHDREHGRVIPIRARISVPKLVPSAAHDDPYGFAAFHVRELAREVVLHELDESLRVNGVRRFDPHDKGVREFERDEQP